MARIFSEVRISPPRNAKLFIFRSARPKVNDASLRALAKQVGMAGKGPEGEVRSDEERLTYREGSRSLTVYRRSGAMRFVDQARWQQDDRKTDVKTADGDAVRSARRFLAKTRLAPLSECRVLKVSRLHVGEMELQTGEGRERTIGLGVIFRRTIKGVPADGPGGRVIVYLDQTGQVSGVDRIWRGIRPGGRKVEGLRSREEVERELAQFADRFGNAKVEVREVRFGYFELGQRAAQDYLQPAYVFILNVSGQDGRIHRKSVFVTAAAVNGIGRLTPAPKPYRKPRSRPEPR